jgi:hypothetical protein
MMRGRFREPNFEANLITEVMELRSSSTTVTTALPRISFRMASFALIPAETCRRP